ncbi:S8 family serine peptidase [Aquimarina aquimarini]|uniref:S8 family serine peptidase n=1 Tax=Aquimarina aquimarini TaxID=1191734 RepID=UPI000D5626F9|nr:S8 family serine peptidase [Aquimarina aquimarini]
MKTQQKILSVMAVLSLTFFSCEKDTEEITEIDATTDAVTEEVGADQAVSGEYIIIYNENKSLYGKHADMQMKSKSTLQKYAIQENNLKYAYSNVVQGFLVKDISKKQAEMLKQDPDIAYIEPNYIYQLDVDMGNPVSTLPATVANKATTNGSTLPNGDYLPWGINRVGRGDGTGKTCWIIDSGISRHNDLNINESKSVYFAGTSWQDENGHGTHVAGTVAAKNNGTGLVGVAHGATVVSVRVFDASGTSSNGSTLAGVDHVARNISSGETWNYSIGPRSRSTSSIVDNAFRNLERVSYGAMAAGNSNDDTQYYSPQRLQTANSWCVGNMTNTDSPARGSNYGSSVDVWAPGTGVWSTWLNGKFNQISGTSMASPHVAGILLLRGNSTGTDGSVSKGGHTAPIATVN